MLKNAYLDEGDFGTAENELGTSNVAGLINPGGPATEARAKRGTHPLYYESTFFRK